MGIIYEESKVKLPSSTILDGNDLKPTEILTELGDVGKD